MISVNIIRDIPLPILGYFFVLPTNNSEITVPETKVITVTNLKKHSVSLHV